MSSVLVAYFFSPKKYITTLKNHKFLITGATQPPPRKHKVSTKNINCCILKQKQPRNHLENAHKHNSDQNIKQSTSQRWLKLKYLLNADRWEKKQHLEKLRNKL